MGILLKKSKKKFEQMVENYTKIGVFGIIKGLGCKSSEKNKKSLDGEIDLL